MATPEEIAAARKKLRSALGDPILAIPGEPDPRVGPVARPVPDFLQQPLTAIPGEEDPGRMLGVLPFLGPETIVEKFRGKAPLEELERLTELSRPSFLAQRPPGPTVGQAFAAFPEAIVAGLGYPAALIGDENVAQRTAASRKILSQVNWLSRESIEDAIIKLADIKVERSELVQLLMTFAEPDVVLGAGIGLGIKGVRTAGKLGEKAIPIVRSFVDDAIEKRARTLRATIDGKEVIRGGEVIPPPQAKPVTRVGSELPIIEGKWHLAEERVPTVPVSPTPVQPTTQIAKLDDVLGKLPEETRVTIDGELVRGGGVPTPPVRPPVEPPIGAASPSTTLPPEVPSGVSSALRRTEAIREIDRPGMVGRAIENIHGPKQVIQYVRPANKVSEVLQTAYVAENNVVAMLTTRAFPTRTAILRKVEKLFGQGATTKGIKTSVPFIGPADELVPVIESTVLDIAQRPKMYDLTPEQRRFLQEWQERNDKLITSTIEEYGSDIKRYPAPEGGVFLSNEDVSIDLLKQTNQSEYQVGLTGRTKTRVFPTAADRIKHNAEQLALGEITKEEVFVPQTNIRLLQETMDVSKAKLAGVKTFQIGSKGKTFIQVMDEAHPGLRSARDKLVQRVKNTKNRIATIERQEIRAKGEGRQVTTQIEQAQKRAKPLLDRVDDLESGKEGIAFGPELSHLSGEIRQILLRADALERRGVVLAERAVAREVKKASLVNELNALSPELDLLRTKYEAAKPGDYELVKENVYRYYHAADARAVREFRSQSTNTLAKMLDDWRATTFGGDLSPIVGIQLPLGVLFDPALAGKNLVGGTKAAWKNQELFRSFRSQTLAKVIAEKPQLFEDFAFFSGVPVTSGTAGGTEFSGGLLRYLHVPGTNISYTRANEAMFSMVLKQAVGLFEKKIEILARRGVVGDAGKAVAADMATKVYPIWNPARLGLSPARASAIRSIPTSISFLLRPATLLTEASTGFVKLALGQTLKPQERMAIELVITAAASVMTLSITSSVSSALWKGRDPWEAIEDVANPTSGHFADVVFGDLYVPLGGPFRGLIKAVVPRQVDWSPIPVPFTGMINYAKNRIGPGIKTQTELLQNRDWEGKKIRKGSIPEQILQSLLYEVENILPLTAGEVMGGMRRGLERGEIFGQAVGQFMGISPSGLTTTQERDTMARKWAKEQGIPDIDYFGNLSGPDRIKFNADPEVMAFEAKKQKRALEDGSLWAELKGNLADIVKDSRKTMQANAEQMGYGRELRNTIDNLASEKGAKQEVTRENARNAGVLDFLEKLEPRQYKFDIALGVYYEKMYDENNPWIDPETKEPNFKKRDAILEELKNDDRVGEAMLEEIAEWIHRNDSPIEVELRKDRETLRPYWERTREKMKKWGLEPVYDEYLGKKEMDRPAFLESRPALVEALAWINAGEGGWNGWQGWKRLYRIQANPEIERLLFKWGYISTFIHPANVGTEEQQRQLQPPPDPAAVVTP